MVMPSKIPGVYLIDPANSLYDDAVSITRDQNRLMFTGDHGVQDGQRVYLSHTTETYFIYDSGTLKLYVRGELQNSW